MRRWFIATLVIVSGCAGGRSAVAPPEPEPVPDSPVVPERVLDRSALERAEEAWSIPNCQYWTWAHQAVALARLERPEALARARQHLQRACPGFSLAFAREKLFYIERRDQLEDYLEGLALAGAAFAYWLVGTSQLGFRDNLGYFFLCGSLAICAMILPGISGSFILVLLGMYGVVLGAVKSLDIMFLLVFAVGAGCGLLCFSRLLHFLLHRFHQGTMALLTGFLFGSLAVVWPWKKVLDWVEGSDGHLKPAQQLPVSPTEFLVSTGQDPQVWLCVALMVVGFAVVWLIDARWGNR